MVMHAPTVLCQFATSRHHGSKETMHGGGCLVCVGRHLLPCRAYTQDDRRQCGRSEGLL